MHRHERRQGRNRTGMFFMGVALIVFGVLQFVQTNANVQWSDMWPLVLVIPGAAIVLRALSDRTGHRGT